MFSKVTRKWFVLVAGAVIFLSGCNFPGATGSSNATDVGPLYTMVHQTLQAQITTTPPGNITPEAPTATIPSQGATGTPTQPLPTHTYAPPTATNTLLPPTAIPIPCNRAQFIKDVTVPDGTIFIPGVSFTKTWQLKNTGSCDWTTDYRLVFVSGNSLSGRESIQIPERVRPGEAINFSVELSAPPRDGRYQGYWMLRSANGQIFGIGNAGDSAFWVSIRVITPPDMGYDYDFAANYCYATWRTGAGKIECPTTSNFEDGRIAISNQPLLENGRLENELTILTRPEEITNGYITGTYPVYRVKNGDHFLADIGCLADSQGCDVTFYLDIIQYDGTVQNLRRWVETYDGRITRVDVDLSAYTGKTVRFVLGVRVNSRPSKANAFWLVPSIQVRAATPTPTATATPTQPATQTPTPTATVTPTLPSVTDSPAADAARRLIAQDLGVDPNLVTVISIEARQWTDSCLGVNIPDQICLPVIIDGYKIILSAEGKMFEAHTNQDGSIIYWFEL